MSTPARLDEELAENIALAAEVSSCIVLAGLRQFDRFLLANPDGAPRTLSLERLIHERVPAQATWVYDPARRRVLLARVNAQVNLKTALPLEVGVEKELPLHETFAAWAGLSTADSATRYALLINSGLLFEDPAAPRDDDFSLVRTIECHARRVDRTHVLLLRVGRTTALPNNLLTVPQVRTVHIPAASRDVRHAYARSRSRELAHRCAVPPEAVAETLSNATEDWTLDQLDALVQTASRQDANGLTDLEELARAVRIGTTHSAWAGSRIRCAVALARDELTKRVLGQPSAVDAVVSALRRSVVGLSSAHQAIGSQAPRAIFFFAGPTGTGKTELAKAIGQLVFGQEQLLRFDCGELQQEHAVARLIGSPPGYVGHDRGGELTDGIRAKPNSVVLFDEIEKASPRLLDALMGVLDDGRLTSGQGETSYFGQSVLIFTSNLGMYEESLGAGGALIRRPRFEYDTPFELIQKTVREAIREEFVTKLGRPEILGRLGGAESIVVFDYLRDLDRVCGKFVANIATNCRRLHNVELDVDTAVIERVVRRTRERPDALVLGGRGLRPELDRSLTCPLADFLFEVPQVPGRVHVTLDRGRTVFSAN